MLTQEWIIKTLISLGLSPVETQVYTFLIIHGPHRGNEIGEQVKLNMPQLSRTLAKLQNNGLITLSVDRPIVFSAMPLVRVLDDFIRKKKDQVELMEKSRKNLYSGWR